MSEITSSTTQRPLPKSPRIKARVTEALLLVLALALGLGAYAIVSFQLEGGLSGSFFTYAGALTALSVISHLVVRHFLPYADPTLMPLALALSAIGIAVIHRVDLAKAAAANPPHEVRGQILLCFIGIVLMVATTLLVRDHRMLRRYTWLSLIAGIVLLLMPMLPAIGRAANGARLWISVAGFTYQPAELAKIFFAIFFASYLVSQRDNLSLAGKKVLGLQLPPLRHMLPILVAWAACMLILVAEKDFGTALLFFGLFVVMLYVATERLSWLMIGGILTAFGFGFIATHVPHIQARFNIWLHAFDTDVFNAKYGSYQLVQGLFGMGSGGIFGTGLGKGYPGLVYAAHEDFIFATIGEELGLVGSLAILALYFLLIMRALRVAVRLRDGFGKLLSCGFAATIALQCFVVVGGVTRIIPLTGLALPFLAHGGSALLTNWIIIGLLLRMSDAAGRSELREAINE